MLQRILWHQRWLPAAPAVSTDGPLEARLEGETSALISLVKWHSGHDNSYLLFAGIAGLALGLSFGPASATRMRASTFAAGAWASCAWSEAGLGS